MIATTLEQSRKLVEIGIDTDTADMFYGYIAPYEFSDRKFDGGYESYPLPKQYPYFDNEYVKSAEIPAWSLAALLDIIGEPMLIKRDGLWHLYGDDVVSVLQFSSPIDACVEMILKLKEQNLL